MSRSSWILIGAVVTASLPAGIFSPAHATALSGAPPAAAWCDIPPGVYSIRDSSGVLIGLLIVYPDCRIEIYPKPLQQPT